MYLFFFVSFFRLLPNGSAKAGLQYGIIMLNSVHSSLRSLLRPPLELFNQERTPADGVIGIIVE